MSLGDAMKQWKQFSVFSFQLDGFDRRLKTKTEN
jgi:hypothetical protein